MKHKRLAEEQTTTDVACTHKISEATLYNSPVKYGRPVDLEETRIKALSDKDTRLKELLAEPIDSGNYHSRRLTRRNLLGRVGLLASAFPVFGRTVFTEAFAASPAADGRTGLVITLQFKDGTTLTFRDKEAQDAGDYAGPLVHQKCFVARAKNGWTIFFRPDADGSRDEIVVERGRMVMSNHETPQNILEPYTAIIFKQGRELARITVPFHWWWSRWRWQSAPRRMVRRPSEIAALLPPYGKSMLYGCPPFSQKVSYAGPMDTAGLDVSMGDPGDRPDIGPVTEAQADFLINGTPAALTAMFAQAEACGSMGIHWRDERTGAFFDVLKNTYWAYRSGDGQRNTIPNTPRPPLPPGLKSGNGADPRWISFDVAHTPCLAFIPYLLTDDPYFLEETQALATLAVAFSNYHAEVQNLPGLVYPGEVRSFAWSIRAVFHAAFASPKTPPSWLLPKAYFERCLSNNGIFVDRYMRSPAKAHKEFFAFPRADVIQGWQTSYLDVALCWGIQLGYKEWLPRLQWIMSSQLAMLPPRAPANGWDYRTEPSPYEWYPLKPPNGVSATVLLSDTSKDAITCADWADAYRTCLAGLKVDPTKLTLTGSTIVQPQSGPLYILELQAAMRWAKRVGVNIPEEALSFLNAQTPIYVQQHFKTVGEARWSIDG